MPSSTLTLFQDFAEQLVRGVHNLAGHTFKVALVNSPAPVVTNTILANLTQITAGGGYVAGGYTLDTLVVTEASGVAKWTIADEVITAVGASVGPFRYAVIYNDTATSPADALVGWYDYGSAVTLADGETMTLDFDPTNGVLTLT